MDYILSHALSLKKNTCLVLGLLSDVALPKEIAALDNALGGSIQRIKDSFQKSGDLRMQSDLQGQALLLVNCGTTEAFNAENLQKYLRSAIKFLQTQSQPDLSLAFPKITAKTPDQQLESMIQIIDHTCYQPHLFKTDQPTPSFKQIALFLPQATAQGLKNGMMLANAITYTRTLADLPANQCTPTYLGKQAEALAKAHSNVTCHVHSLKEITQLKMGGLLAVSQGSTEPPCFIEISYQHQSAKTAPIVLVGKGVTFDAGGISLKPPTNMNEMKYDMIGAASVLGAIQACATLQLPIHVVGLIPCTENLPSGHAVKPGDVITMMSGLTVEVLNTDAEGRLILADALTFAERFKPRYVIDIATLTGAVIVALGHVATGLMSPDDELASLLLDAAKQSLDKTWQLPLFDDYQDHLDSPIADMINANFDRSAGSITAGIFLSKFTKKYRWAHLDIAGTGWVSGSKRIATGRPVPLLMEFLRHACTSS